MTKEDKELINSVSHLLNEVVDCGFDTMLFACQDSEEPLLKLRCRLQKEYYQAREKLRVPKDKELTDFDRNTMLQAFCAEKQEEFEYVKGLEEIIKERIISTRLYIEAEHYIRSGGDIKRGIIR